MKRVVRVAWPLLLLFAACREETGERAGSDAEHAAGPFHVEHAPSGEAVVVLSPEALAAAGLATAAPVARAVAEEVAAFGTLVADPSRVGVLRAPLAGTIVADPSRRADGAAAWPAIGARIEGGAPLGTLAPRTAPLTTAELADLQARIATARAEELATQAELAAAKSAHDRAQQLNARDKGVSDQALEGAAAVVKAAEARLAAARASVAIFEKVVQSSSSAGALVLAPLPLVAPRSGEVIAVLAQPGENVEAGAEILRVAEFGELFADVRLPASASATAPSKARVVVNGGVASASFEAVVVGPVPAGDVVAPMLRLRVRDPAGGLRPGPGVTAWLATGGAARPAFAVPASAIVRYASRSWIYVELAPGRFARRPVDLLRSDGDSVLLSSGVAAGAQVVTVGAMTLLSQEQIAAGGGEGE